MATDPLAAIRAKLKATKPASQSKSDPLAALRAQVKAGKSVTTPKTVPILPSESSGSLRLARLEAVVNLLASGAPAAQLTAIKEAISRVQ
jgi:hypothetical protein